MERVLSDRLVLNYLLAVKVESMQLLKYLISSEKAIHEK